MIWWHFKKGLTKCKIRIDKWCSATASRETRSESDYCSLKVIIFWEIIHFQILQFIVTRITSMIRICITLLFLPRAIHHGTYLYSRAMQEWNIELLFWTMYADNSIDQHYSDTWNIQSISVGMIRKTQNNQPTLKLPWGKMSRILCFKDVKKQELTLEVTETPNWVSAMDWSYKRKE